MEKFKHKWHMLPRAARKPLVFVAGIAVVACGIALLVLPGPGWAVIFVGLAILATEFSVAADIKQWVTAKFKGALEAAKKGIGGKAKQ